MTTVREHFFNIIISKETFGPTTPTDGHLPIPSCYCQRQSSKQCMGLGHHTPFLPIAIQRHFVKMVYLVSQVCHYSHVSIHKKDKLIKVITPTKRTTKQHHTAHPCSARQLVYVLLPNTATPNCSTSAWLLLRLTSWVTSSSMNDTFLIFRSGTMIM